MGFPIDDRKMKRAGLDYWDKLKITYYESLDDFMEQMDGRLYLISKFAEKVYSEENFEAEEAASYAGVKYPQRARKVF